MDAEEDRKLAVESSPLTWSIAVRDEEAVKELLEKDPSLVNEVGQYSFTPLMRAVHWVRFNIRQAEKRPDQERVNKSIRIVATILAVKQDLAVKNEFGDTAHAIAGKDGLSQIAAMIEEKSKQAGGRRSRSRRSHRRRATRRRTH
jgi:hypothetical protein